MQNAATLQKKLAEKEQLLSTLDQAKMQEALNKATAQLTSTLGDDVPTFNEVRKKIDDRLVRAEGGGAAGRGRSARRSARAMLEVERAQANAEAQARVSR